MKFEACIWNMNLGFEAHIWQINLGVEACIRGNHYILTWSPAADKVSNQSSFEISPNFSLSALIKIMVHVAHVRFYIKRWIPVEMSLQYGHHLWLYVTIFADIWIIIFYMVFLPIKMFLQLVQLILVHCSFPLLLWLICHQLPTHLKTQNGKHLEMFFFDLSIDQSIINSLLIFEHFEFSFEIKNLFEIFTKTECEFFIFRGCFNEPHSK